jgi:hypothetical protein
MTEPRFFYTIDTPYQWSQGKIIVRVNDSGEYISSLEEAELLAIKNTSGSPDSDDFVLTTYGVEFTLQ